MDPGLRAAVPFRFACQRCARCCSGGSGFVWVEEGEIEALARALDATPESFASRFVRRAIDPRTGAERLTLREVASEGGRCALLVGRNECAVYDARPRHCRTFPHWPSVLAGGEAFEAARATCPGIAIVVDEALRRRAYEALEAFHGRDASAIPSAGCCLDRAEADALYVTALEADYASDRGRDEGGCRLGPARPLGCRTAESEERVRDERRAALRELERGFDYPLSYGPIVEMLKARGAEVAR